VVVVRKRDYSGANRLRAERVKRANAAGLCGYCKVAPLPRPPSARKNCDACRAKLNANGRRCDARRRDQGLCLCGAAPRPGKKSCHDCKIRNRFASAKTEYKLTDAQVLRLKAATVCELCGRPPRPGKALCVDHHHGTGLFRGVLCKSCNTMLGLGQDSPEVLRKAAEYLERSGLCGF